MEDNDQLKLFEISEDWNRIWKEMPEYNQKDLTPFKTVYIHFENKEDMIKFAELIQQNITMETISCWYPKADIATFMAKKWVDNETEQKNVKEDIFKLESEMENMETTENEFTEDVEDIG